MNFLWRQERVDVEKQVSEKFRILANGEKQNRRKVKKEWTWKSKCQRNSGY